MPGTKGHKRTRGDKTGSDSTSPNSQQEPKKQKQQQKHNKMDEEIMEIFSTNDQISETFSQINDEEATLADVSKMLKFNIKTNCTKENAIQCFTKLFGMVNQVDESVKNKTTQLNSRITKLDKDMSSRMSDLDTKLQKNHDSLTNDLNEVDDNIRAEIEEKFKASNLKLSTFEKEIKEKISEVENISNKKCATLKTDLSKTNTMCKKTAEDVLTINNSHNLLRSDVQKMESRLSKLESQAVNPPSIRPTLDSIVVNDDQSGKLSVYSKPSLDRTVIIKGLPFQNGENLWSKLQILSQDLQVAINRLDVLVLERLFPRKGRKARVNKTPAIRLALSNYLKLSEILDNRGNLTKKVRSRDIWIMLEEDGRTRKIRSLYDGISTHLRGSGHNVRVTIDGIKIDGVTYSCEEYDKIPTSVIPRWGWVTNICGILGINLAKPSFIPNLMDFPSLSMPTPHQMPTSNIGKPNHNSKSCSDEINIQNSDTPHQKIPHRIVDSITDSSSKFSPKNLHPPMETASSSNTSSSTPLTPTPTSASPTPSLESLRQSPPPVPDKAAPNTASTTPRASTSHDSPTSPTSQAPSSYRNITPIELKCDIDSIIEQVKQKGDLTYQKGINIRKCKLGILFQSSNAFLSNLYYCKFSYTFNCLTTQFKSSEHAYQFYKALICKENDKAKKILDCASSYSAMEIGKTIVAPPGHLWHSLEKTVLKNVVTQKFVQNKDLLIDLLRTLPHNLVEGSTSKKWGGGFQFNSTNYNKGQMNGGNAFGIILTEIRNSFAIEFGMLANF